MSGFTLKRRGTLDVQRCLDCPFYENEEEERCGADLLVERGWESLRVAPAARTDMNGIPPDCPLRDVVVEVTFVHPEVRGVQRDIC